MPFKLSHPLIIHIRLLLVVWNSVFVEKVKTDFIGILLLGVCCLIGQFRLLSVVLRLSVPMPLSIGFVLGNVLSYFLTNSFNNLLIRSVNSTHLEMIYFKVFQLDLAQIPIPIFIPVSNLLAFRLFSTLSSQLSQNLLKCPVLKTRKEHIGGVYNPFYHISQLLIR